MIMKRHLCFVVLVSILLIFVGASFSLPPPEPLSSFQCSGGVASVGDTNSDVIAKCGEPNRVQKIRGEMSEQWTYNFSAAKKLYFLEFQRGRLERIESSEY
jgi:hypothetical protein